MKVWVIECDHVPMQDKVGPQRVRAYPNTPDGTHDMRRQLNKLPTNMDGPYYDAVLYERIESLKR